MKMLLHRFLEGGGQTEAANFPDLEFSTLCPLLRAENVIKVFDRAFGITAEQSEAALQSRVAGLGVLCHDLFEDLDQLACG